MQEEEFSRLTLKGRSIPGKGASTCKGEEAQKYAFGITGVWHGGQEAELDRGVSVPTLVASGPRHMGISVVLGGRKEAGKGKTFIERY